MDTNYQSKNSYSLKSLRQNVKRSAYVPLLVVGLIVLIVLGFSLRNIFAGKSTVISNNGSKKITIEKAKETQELNKNFAFSLRDDKGKEVSKVQYLLRSAELRDEILVKGEKAYAIEGREFLVLNIKITNSYERPVQINARDYIRMTVNGGSEKLAPEIHSDPAEVQAISTKETRVGFSVNDKDKDFVLYIGEVTGDKQQIKLSIQ